MERPDGQTLHGIKKSGKKIAAKISQPIVYVSIILFSDLHIFNWAPMFRAFQENMC